MRERPTSPRPCYHPPGESCFRYDRPDARSACPSIQSSAVVFTRKFKRAMRLSAVASTSFAVVGERTLLRTVRVVA